MNSSAKTFLTALFAVATLVLAALLFQARQQLAQLEQKNALDASDRDAALKRATEAEQRLASADKRRASAEAELKTLREKPAAAPDAAPARRRDPGAGFAALDNPAVQKVMANSMKGGLDQRYAALFRKLKLSPADLEKFKNLLVEKQMSGLDVMRAAQSQGLNPDSNPAGFSALMTKAQGEVDDNIRSLLGDQGFGQFQDYNQNIGSYGLLDQIERRLSYTNAPLDGAQTEALLLVLGETAKSPIPAGAAGGAMASFVQGMGAANPMLAAMTQPRITDQTIAAAQGVLGASQIEVLKQLQAEQQSQAATMQSLRGGVPPASSAPPQSPAPRGPGG